MTGFAGAKFLGRRIGRGGNRRGFAALFGGGRRPTRGFLNEETEIHLDMLPTFSGSDIFRGDTSGFGELGLGAKRTMMERVLTRKVGNAIDMLVEVGNLSFMDMTEAHVPERTLLIT